MSTARRALSGEFTKAAARQVTELGRPISQVARELALRPEQIRDRKQKRIARGDRWNNAVVESVIAITR